MARILSAVSLAALLLTASSAMAASVNIQISDTHGLPVARAVVALEPQAQLHLPASPLPQNAVIDQRHETFIPLVTVIRQGGEVVFTNNDTTMHQVYSFSPVKQFEFEIDQGQKSQPVTFDKAGVAAIGCNIHDQMIAYVYVADTPFIAVTDANGRAVIGNVPDGAWRATVWHPQLPPGKSTPSAALTVSGTAADFALAVPLVAAGPGTRRMHMGDY